MKCEDWQEVMLDREQLDPAEEEVLSQHLASCAGCRAWANALAETDALLASQLPAQLDSAALHPRITRALRRERSWMIGAPEMLEALGWNALAVLLMAGLLLGSNWEGWRLWLAAAVTLSGSLAWAGRVLIKDWIIP
jgi:predicted anti-sigma-YlaC factor YlaD